MSRWKPFRYRLEALGCRLLARGIPRLSRRACVRLGNALGALAFALDARGRAVALANLECAFGGRFSPTQRREIARASYRNFVRTMLDLFWASRLTPENFRTYLKLEGFEELQAKLRARGGGALFYCIHQGNWEWASIAFGFLGLGTSIVAENFKNPRLTEIFSARREVSGHRIIPQEGSLLRLLKVVKRGGWAGLLIDLNLRPSQAATVIGAWADGDGGAGLGSSSFSSSSSASPALRRGEKDEDEDEEKDEEAARLHAPRSAPGPLLMCVPLLHAVLAQRGGALLVPVESQPLPDGTCRVIAHPPVEWPEGASVREIAQRCWDALEPVARARPGEYLWPYKHFRHRPRDAAREYPFYANESGKFEKLQQEVGRTRDEGRSKPE